MLIAPSGDAAIKNSFWCFFISHSAKNRSFKDKEEFLSPPSASAVTVVNRSERALSAVFLVFQCERRTYLCLTSRWTTRWGLSRICQSSSVFWFTAAEASCGHDLYDENGSSQNFNQNVWSSIWIALRLPWLKSPRFLWLNLVWKSKHCSRKICSRLPVGGIRSELDRVVWKFSVVRNCFRT